MGDSLDRGRSAPDQPRRELGADRGSAFVESLVLVGVVGLVVGAAVYTIGNPLLLFYHTLQLFWACPFP